MFHQLTSYNIIKWCIIRNLFQCVNSVTILLFLETICLLSLHLNTKSNKEAMVMHISDTMALFGSRSLRMISLLYKISL